jgi:beta-lactamase regulating signal transducer with metallopeptidase domain
MTTALLDHIWQSTLFAGMAWLLTLAFHRNGAALRFWLWFAASIKFLVPFAGLVAVGEYFSRQYHAPVLQSLLVLRPGIQKLSAPATMLAMPQPQTINWALLLAAIWFAGLAAILGIRLLHWTRLRATMVHARDLPVSAPVRIKTSSSLLEPGLVGILRPAVLMPAGLMTLLSDAERDSILAHELSHFSRRDNVTAVIHMTVEALFWFYPPVWLIGARLIAERERACDESVLASGHDPEVYAGGILKVCKFCIQSPLACVSGVSGADLGMRVRQIMTAEAARDVGAAQKMLLAGACTMALVLPVMAGFVDSPLGQQVKHGVLVAQARAGQAVAVMAQQIGMAPLTPVIVAKLPPLKVRVVTTPPSPAKAEVASATPPPAQASAPAEPQPEPPAAAAAPASAPAPVLNPVSKDVATVLYPRGDGDPDAVICRASQLLPGSRLAGPRVCETNRVWAQLRASGREIGPDGMLMDQAKSPTRISMSGGCEKSALLGAIQPWTPSPGMPLNGCH